MTLEDMNNATSSAELEDGRLLLNGQDGKAQSGPGAVPVSRFRAQDKEKAMPTNATSGPLFNNSSPSADLCMSLGNRLAANLEGSGSPLYKLIWSTWDMPAGPQICRQRASARRTSGKDFSGWPRRRQQRDGTQSEIDRNHSGIIWAWRRYCHKTVADCWRNYRRGKRAAHAVGEQTIGLADSRKRGTAPERGCTATAEWICRQLCN